MRQKKKKVIIIVLINVWEEENENCGAMKIEFNFYDGKKESLNNTTNFHF